MQKLIIPYSEFYITNVCNLSCNGCNRFNNYSFKGFQRWEDYKDIYTQWSKEVDLKSVAILGGEPLLNPTFMSWVQGVTALWPDASVRIITNGYQLQKVTGLYELLTSTNKIQLWVGIHNKKDKHRIVDQVKLFLTAPYDISFNNENQYQEFMLITDANNVTVRVEYNWWFHQGAIVKTDTGDTLHNSDPKKAHDICHMSTCHHFIKGRLYKCGVVALLPDFDQQHTLALSDSDRQLMESYVPLDITADYQSKANFVNNLDKQIDQCKFCPENYVGQQIYAEEKIMIKRNRAI